MGALASFSKHHCVQPQLNKELTAQSHLQPAHITRSTHVDRRRPAAANRSPDPGEAVALSYPLTVPSFPYLWLRLYPAGLVPHVALAVIRSVRSQAAAREPFSRRNDIQAFNVRKTRLKCTVASCHAHFKKHSSPEKLMLAYSLMT